MLYHPGQQQIAASLCLCSVAQCVTIQDFKPPADGAKRELLPAKVDNLGAIAGASDVPEMALDTSSRPDLSASKFEIGVEVLHHAGGGIALAEGRVIGVKNAIVCGQMIPRNFQCRRERAEFNGTGRAR